MKYKTKPLLIKAGSDILGLGKTLDPPLKDCRVVAEEYYQEMLKEKRILLEVLKFAQSHIDIFTPKKFINPELNMLINSSIESALENE